ncbi:hypothetical protein HYALB_00003105 [Hymenoscyphus albidus]|uniref:Uncharacterized protein n=1 Tax=Hymenoscyphus albidus TaxID=595503 RepID=A0A9N9LFF0_9HELO|nr:hypothetical protein HYALB_00003105 [Hymenoscyphus albidus]
METEQQQRPLFEDETSNNDVDISLSRKRSQSLRSQNPVILILLVLSFGLNAFLSIIFFLKPHTTYSSHNIGLTPGVQKMQRWRYTAYSQPNETARYSAWNSIDVDRTIIAIDHDEAVALGLPATEVFPLDERKDIYAVNAYHQLHCLKLLYRSFQEAHHGKAFSNGYTHILHCLDSIRGDVECQADDHVYGVGPGLNPPIYEGQHMHCKNSSALDKWASEHHSFFKYTYVNDEKSLTEMHQWRNCPENSPHGENMRKLLGYGDDWKPDYEGNFGAEFREGYEEKVLWDHQ